MSPRAIGVEAKAPNELVPGSAKRQRTRSFATLCEVIDVRVVARVFARSWLCAGHAPAFAAHSGGGRPRAVRAGETGVAVAIRPATARASRALRT